MPSLRFCLEWGLSFFFFFPFFIFGRTLGIGLIFTGVFSIKSSCSTMYSRQVKMFWLEIVSTYSLSQWVYRKGGMRKWLHSLVLAKYGKFCKSGVFFSKRTLQIRFFGLLYRKVVRSCKKWQRVVKKSMGCHSGGNFCRDKSFKSKGIAVEKNCTAIPALRPKNGGRDRTLNL